MEDDKRELRDKSRELLDEQEEKLLLLAQAASDPLFLEDVKEVAEDFKHV